MEEPEWSEDEGAYLISNLEELNWIRNDLDNDYVLVSDIDASETETWNDGLGWKPIGNTDDSFSGVFDGQRYEVKDLYIDRIDEDSGHIALFGNVGNPGVIKNVGVVNVEVTGYRETAALLGGIGSGTVVSNSYATGNVTGEDVHIGGLIGTAYEGVIDNCYADVEVMGEFAVGGLIGGRFNGEINGCYAIGDVTGEGSSVGGLVGIIRGYYSETRNSYATGNVTTGEVPSVGGLIGLIKHGTIENSFCDKETTGQENAVGMEDEGGTSTNVEALTTEEMQDISTFEDAGWDIELTNEGNPTGGYPFLSWQINGSSTWYISGGEPEKGLPWMLIGIVIAIVIIIVILILWKIK